MNSTKIQPPAAGEAAHITALAGLRNAFAVCPVVTFACSSPASGRQMDQYVVFLDKAIRACNAHAGLVEALESANKALTRCADEYEAAKMKYRAGFIGEEQVKIAAALAAAKEAA